MAEHKRLAFARPTDNGNFNAIVLKIAAAGDQQDLFWYGI
jgi:hypothetical protein